MDGMNADEKRWKSVWWRWSATGEVNEMMVVGEWASHFSWASTLIESFAKIFIFEEERDFLEKLVDVIARGVGIDRRDAGADGRKNCPPTGRFMGDPDYFTS